MALLVVAAVMVVVRTFVDVILLVVVKGVEEDVTVCPEGPHVQAQEGGGAVPRSRLHTTLSRTLEARS